MKQSENDTDTKGFEEHRTYLCMETRLSLARYLLNVTHGHGASLEVRDCGVSKAMHILDGFPINQSWLDELIALGIPEGIIPLISDGCRLIPRRK